jgi:CRISPR-associated protein Cmr6
MREPLAPLPRFDAKGGWHDCGHGNFGLWYDKHCDRWQSDYGKLYEPDQNYQGGRLDWIERAVTAPRAEWDDRLKEFAERQRVFVEACGGLCFRAKTVTKFASGLRRAHPVLTGFEWHYTLGVPVLRSSGQKGMVWDWVRVWRPSSAANSARILGTADRAGSVDFLPGLPTVPPPLCVDGTTPHLSKYYQGGGPPADWYSPTPLQWLAVDEGAEFQFAVVPAPYYPSGSPEPAQRQADVATACRWLADALATIGAGAGTAVDRGRFSRPDPDPLK